MVQLTTNDQKWATAPTGFDAADLQSLGHLALDLRVCGKAAPAGVSFATLVCYR